MPAEGKDYVHDCMDKGKCSYLRIEPGKGKKMVFLNFTWNFVKAVTLTIMMDTEIC